MVVNFLKKFIGTTALVFILTNCTGQYFFYNDKYFNSDIDIEFGVSGGMMNALTDLGGKKGLGKGFIKDLNGKNFQASGGIFMSGLYQQKIGLRLEATFGSVKAYDSILSGKTGVEKNRYDRNLSFKSPITEFSAMAEIYPLEIFRKDGDFTESEPPTLMPYILAGVGFYSFRPQAKLNGVWVGLQPLRTEGQGFSQYPEVKKYELSQINVPVGIGVKYELGPLLTARFELVHRFLSTDYLDDVSGTYIDPTLFNSYLNPAQAALAQQLHNRSYNTTPGFSGPGGLRGDKKDKDAYFSFNFKLGLNLSRKKIN
jgi:hypothetical protein